MAHGLLTTDDMAFPERPAHERGSMDRDVVEATPRADAILTLARNAFVEKGFDGASMRDLARAADMSVGNFYRYFPSKAALVEALIARDLAEVEETFQAIAASADPMAALKAALRERLMSEDCKAEDALWAEIIATGARKPEVAGALRRMEEGIVGRISDVLALVHQVPADQALGRFGAHGRLIFLIMHGAMSNNHADQPSDHDLTALILRTIDWLVDDALIRRPGD